MPLADPVCPFPQDPVMPSHRTKAHSIIAALAICAGTSSTLAAASYITEQPSPSASQTFDQLDLGVEPIAGVLIMNAESGWVWREGSTNRITLDRDIIVEVGGSILRARRADLWISTSNTDQTSQATNQARVFGIFENLTSDDGSFSGSRVPVRAIINLEESIKLRLGAQINEPPSRKDMIQFLDRSANLYNTRLLGIEPVDSTQQQTLRWAPKELNATDPQATTQTATRSIPASEPARLLSRAERAIEGMNVSIPEPTPEPAQQSAQRTTQPTPKPLEPIFQSTGIFSLAIDGKVVVQGAQQGIEGQPDRPATVTAEGGVTMQYQDPATRQSMDLQAERAVIFLKDGESTNASPSQLNASEIEGIYLEGGVFAGNADWSVRSPKIYVDLARDKMLMLDAVFWTVDQRTNMPLYLRADSVRQTSLGEFEASKARIANNAFFEPDVSIGVSDLKVSVRQEERPRTGLLGLVGSVREGLTTGTDSGGTIAAREPGSDLVRRVFIDGKNVTLRLGSIPVLWVPRVKGNTDAFPLKEIRVGDSNQTGVAVRTRWDAFSLFGVDPIPDVRANLQLDYYGERGFAFGFSGDWNTDKHRGSLYSYLLPNDNGTDILSSGRRIDRTDQTRGMVQFSDIWNLADPWTLITKGTYISDEAYIPAFEERLGRETPDFDSMLRLERTSETNQFAFELSGSPNDFLAAEHQLLSPGYAVDKIPEASFVSVANDLLPETMPGVFQYQYEASVGAMRLRFSEVTAAEYGFDTTSLAMNAFGTAPGVSLADTQRLLGLDEDTVGRFDTRHEVSARFDLGPLRLNPFVVGRVTAYDTSFDTFTPQQTDNARYWGAAGMTVSTTLTRVNDSASSDFLDIHRIRHIVEPSMTFWQADSAFAVSDTPIFDDDVEGLLRGSMFRAAIDQTWQTKRGGPGRWRDADILKINTEYVWSSDRAGTSPLPNYFAPRPELSNPGTFIGTDAIFSPTDVLAFSGSAIYDLDLDRTARTSGGVILQHQPGFMSSIEYRDIRAIDSTFLSARSQYTLTDKYSVSAWANYNFDQGDFQNFTGRIDRRFQIGVLGLTVNFDNIRNETTIGFVFRPFGTSGTNFGTGGDFFTR